MTLFRRYSFSGLFLLFLFLNPTSGSSQVKIEDWQDPVDIGVFDLADNKLLLYNLIGTALIHFFSKERSSILDSDSYNAIQFNWYKEYRKTNQPTILDLKYRTGRKWKQRLWVGVETMAYVVKDQQRQFGGIGLSPFFTWNIINVQSIRLSFDNGVGPLYFFSTFPEGGTKFNFSTTYGLQFEIKFSNISLSLGARNTHFSNAFLAGKNRNPAFDGFGMYLSTRF